MPYYLSQHKDYTSANYPGDVDTPAKPRLIVAANAFEAIRKSWEIDREEGLPSGTSIEDVADETTIVLLDPLFDKMRTQGWTVEPPEEFDGI